MIVRNSVVDDSRVLKSAWSLGEGGWDVLVLGASKDGIVDQFTVGAAAVVRVPAKVTVQSTFLMRVARKLRYLKDKYLRKFLQQSMPGVPGLSRAVNAMAPYALAFKPHVIHAHDYTALPIAEALAKKLRDAGTKTKLIYDAHEYLQGVHHLSPLAHIAYTFAEKEGAQKSDAVIVVSEEMAPLIRDYLSLDFDPVVVANDPVVEGRHESPMNIRSSCGLAVGVPLLVYSGAVAPQRGLGTVVEALPSMPDVHLAIIAQTSNPHVPPLIEQAQKLGVGDRVHVLPYVPNAELVSFLSTADIGLIPLLHRPNHEISLITKFGEYAQANLPILVSDVRTMATEVRRIGNGEVFTAGNAISFVEAANKVLNDLARYRAAYTPEVLFARSWERQAEVLLDLYAKLIANAEIEPLPDGTHPFKLTEPVPLSGPAQFAR